MQLFFLTRVVFMFEHVTALISVLYYHVIMFFAYSASEYSPNFQYQDVSLFAGYFIDQSQN